MILPCIAALAGPLPAQLPFLTAPEGTLRIEFRGAFTPATAEYADGHKRDLGAPLRSALLDQGSSAMVRDLTDRLTSLLGTPVAGASLGSLGADLAFERGVGTIGLAVGVTPRITIGIDLPIVSVRTEATLTPDPTGATLGLNPARFGDQRSAAYLEQLDAALTSLDQRIAAGDYDSNPELLAAAQALAASGPGFSTAVAGLLTDPATASAVLPLAASSAGMALIDSTGAIRDQLTNRFGIGGFSASIALPTTAVDQQALTGLLGSPAGFDLADIGDPPLASLGDIRMGATVSILDRRDGNSGRGLRMWGVAGVRFPTGTAPRPRYLRDQGTGSHAYAIDLAGIVEQSLGGSGVRASIGFTREFAAAREARVGMRDEFLLPVSRLTTLDRRGGNLLAIRAEPWIRLAPNLAFTGSASYLKRAETSWSESAATGPISGGDIAAMGDGTGFSALRLGLGLSYAHPGRNREGVQRMPVEAGLGIERTVSSGSGLATARLTTKVWFRVYKRLFSR